MIAVDPNGEEFYLTWHEVGAGHNHAAVRFVPKNQGLHRNDQRFQNIDSSGNRYVVLSAGPVPPLNGSLVSDINRQSDLGEQAGQREIAIPDGLSEEQVFGAMIAADAQYDDNLDYDLFPRREGNRRLFVADDGYNSNRYVSSLLGAVELPAPDIEGTENLSFPVYQKPVPQSEFMEEAIE